MDRFSFYMYKTNSNGTHDTYVEVTRQNER